jgi:hypothetical protein
MHFGKDQLTNVSFVVCNPRKESAHVEDVVDVRHLKQYSNILLLH